MYETHEEHADIDATTPATELLERIRGGDSDAVRDLVPLVYDELRRRARAIRKGGGPCSIESCELIDMAYPKLIDQRNRNWRNRAQFVAIATTLMRREFIDYYRKRRADKRGGGAVHDEFDEIAEVTVLHDSDRESRLANRIDVAHCLHRLQGADSKVAEAIGLYYFGGLTIKEICEVTAVSAVTVHKRLKAARAALSVCLSERTEQRPGETR